MAYHKCMKYTAMENAFLKISFRLLGLSLECIDLGFELYNNWKFKTHSPIVEF